MNLLATLLPLAQDEPFVRDPADTGTTCVAENDTVCVGWALDNIDRYVTPTLEHLELVVLSVVFGFALAFAMALLSHRRRWLVPTFTGVTGVLYTIPSVAFFLLLLPITGRGTAAAKDSGRGMGMTEGQLLWRVELPLAVPEIIAGLRIATVSTVAIATLAFFAGAGGLGAEIYNDIDFKTGIVVAGGIAILIAIAFDALLIVAQRLLAPWRRVRPV